MALHRSHNVYKGINAHLHSYYQRGNDWPSFHTLHIGDLMRALQTALPPESGYFVAIEQSLQITQYDAFIGAVTISRLDEDDTLTLITRIELLSPANKPPGSHAGDYRAKRTDTLRGGIKLVELDYLHERRSPVDGVADYTQRVAGSYPYTILASESQAGRVQTEVYGFRVDDPLPVVPVPLLGKQALPFDFGAVYQQTFLGDARNTRLFVDYAQEPVRFERYDDADQRRIRAVMARATQPEAAPDGEGA